MKPALGALVIVLGFLGFTFGGLYVAFQTAGQPGLVGAVVGLLGVLLGMLSIAIGNRIARPSKGEMR